MLAKIERKHVIFTIGLLAVLVVLGASLLNRYDVDISVEKEPKLHEEMCIRKKGLEFPGKIDILQVKRLGNHGALVTYFCYQTNDKMYEIEIKDIKRHYEPVACNCDGLR